MSTPPSNTSQNSQGQSDPCENVQQLKHAIDTEDVERAKRLLTDDPSLHQAPLGYSNNGPLTWVAECRVPWNPPSAARLELASWMIENGSDIHQGGDGPLMRAALNGDRIPMMELLVSKGADVNALWNGDFPIIHAPCETVDPLALKWLLDHGANPNCGQNLGQTTALDYLLGTYFRSTKLSECIDHLIVAGGCSSYEIPEVFELLRGQLNELKSRIKADPSLVYRRFPNLDIGATGGRRLTLEGSTLLHVAAEFGNLDVAQLLIDHGADINALATKTSLGDGGQSPIFHAVSQYFDFGLPMTQLLIEHGASLTIVANLPGSFDSPDEFVTCSPLQYAQQFPNDGRPNKTLTYLTEQADTLHRDI
jgi:ankyrin repeat protein